MRKTIFKSMTAACVALLLLFALAPAAFAADSDPAVLDTNTSLFAALVAINKPHADPHCYTVGELTGDLDLSNRSITSVAGLENCVGITRLNLGGNNGLADLTPFNGKSMTALKELYLNDTAVATLPNNLQMPALETLDLSGTPVTDAGLAGIGTSNLPQLKYMSLARCSTLQTIANLSSLSTLQLLNLSEAGLTDLPDMTGMTNLTELFINGSLPFNATDPKGPTMHVSTFINKVATLPKFKNANTDYVSLCISNTDVDDASFLDTCAGIKLLIWGYLDFEPDTFPKAANLYYLDVSNNTMVNNGTLTSIATDMPLFSTYDASATPAELCINATGVTDVSNLKTAAGLNTLLWMNMPSLTEAKGLASLTQLTSVDLSYDTGLGNAALTPAALPPNLQSLAAMGCGITNLPALAGMAKLNMLSVGENQITSLAPLFGMNLTTLFAPNNLIHDLAPLAGMTNLTSIDVSMNHIDTSAGSPDRGILDTIAARPGSFVIYTPQLPQPPALSADSTLTGLTASQPMTPAFAPATLSYSVAVPGAADHVTLTATPAYGETVTIDGVAGLSRDVAIAPGETKAVPIAVTAQNGVNTSTYTVTVTRAKLDTACKLTGIGLAPSAATLSPAFSPAATAYTVTLPSNVGSVTITPAKPEKATMTIGGAANPAATVSLGYGETKTVEIVVTAENKTDKTTYRLTVKRAKPDASKLMSLGCSAGSLSPAFNPYKTGYTLTLPKNTGSVTLKPVKATSSSKLYINGKLASSKTFKLAAGKSVKVTVKVVAASGATCTYTITIKR